MSSRADTWVERVTRDSMWEDAWEILAGTYRHPPSLEGFEHTLETARDRAGTAVTAVQHARTLVDACPRKARVPGA